MKQYLKNHIKEFRTKNNYTQGQLGIFLGVSKNTISMWEHGDFDPTLINICKLLDIFDCTFEELFEYAPKYNFDKKIIVKEGECYERLFTCSNL